MLNPVLEETPMPKRATSSEEAEMLHWAASGVTRVSHALGAGGTRLATLAELLTAHPALSSPRRTLGAGDGRILAKAEKVAFLQDVMAHVTTAKHATKP